MQVLTTISSQALHDRLVIRELIENWAAWRDSGQWERLRTVWHEDGQMCSTWRQSSAAEFIEGCRDGFEKGVNVVHTMGGCSVDVIGDRAVAQTRMTIGQRAQLHGVLVDVLCYGRFYDFFERRQGRWGLVLRQPVYDKDSMKPVDPAVTLPLEQERLDSFPEGYRYLAYLQTELGLNVKPDMPGARGPQLVELYERGRAWLDTNAQPKRSSAARE